MISLVHSLIHKLPQLDPLLHIKAHSHYHTHTHTHSLPNTPKHLLIFKLYTHSFIHYNFIKPHVGTLYCPLKSTDHSFIQLPTHTHTHTHTHNIDNTFVTHSIIHSFIHIPIAHPLIHTLPQWRAVLMLQLLPMRYLLIGSDFTWVWVTISFLLYTKINCVCMEQLLKEDL